MSASARTVQTVEGEGGNLLLISPAFSMSASAITVQTVEGEGGNLLLNSPAFSMSASASTVQTVEGEGDNLFRVMRIVPDMQDYGVVERIQLAQDEVIRLCNKLASSSAFISSDEPPRAHINFNSLNQQCLSAVGFYGDKNMITRTFRKESLVDRSVLAKMERRLLEPGFYVSTLPGKERCAILFYWHEGEQLKQASRKDLSCNFIRYLVELCDSVYVCVEESYRFEALAASALESTSSKTKRTKRIQASSVKNSENDVKLLSSYDLRIAGGAYSEKSSLEASENVQNANNYYGTAVFCEGYQHCCFLTTEKSGPRKYTKVEELSVKASVFVDMLKSWSSASNVDYSRLSNEQFVFLQEICNTSQFEKFERCVLKVIPEFCPRVLLFVGGESSERKLEQNLCSDAGRLKQLHEELSAIFTGKDGKLLLLLGSDVKFISSDGEHVLTVGCGILGQGKQTSPFISYGQEVDAKCSRHCSCSSKIDGMATFLKSENGKEDFPLSGEVVKIVFSPVSTAESSSEKEIKGKIQIEKIYYSAIRSWVESRVPTELKNLETNLVFTAFLLASDKCLAQTFIQTDLTIQNMQIQLPIFQGLFEKFVSVHFEQSEFHLKTLLSNNTLKTVCCNVYKASESKFRENIKELWTLLFRKGESLVKCRLGDGEHEFVQNLKKEVSVTRHLEKVTVRCEKRQSLAGQSSQAEIKLLNVKMSIVEEHPFHIVYKVCELKKDVSEASSNSNRPIVLTCGESAELVTINPHERLHKVVILKSRELIVFVHSCRDSSLYVYRCPNFGVNINMDKPVHVFRRGFDLVAVDEATRSIALYEKEKSKILVYMFDESFSNVYWSGVEVNLESFNGSKSIVWMHFIPGKMELLLVDDTNRARVAEIHEKPLMKAKHISLPSQKHSLRACVSDDGYFFLVFRRFQSQTEHNNLCPESVLDVYVLGDIMSHLKTIPLSLNARECRISDFEQFGVKFINFGSQTLLLLYAPGIIFSHVLKYSLGQIKALEDETQIDVSCRYLGYIYHIFDKFATSPKLFPDAKKHMTFNVAVEGSGSDRRNSEACLKYSKALIEELKVGKDKDFSSMKIQFKVDNVETYTISAAAEQETEVRMATWIRKLICLVPIQIARVKNNAMVAVKDGLEMLRDVSYEDSASLADCMRFGFYDAVISSWEDKIKVISSMGKRSSGKSYLLNHLSGSLFDVAGGRCRDGVWMTVVTGEDGDSSCLYVLLDFEGLGSLERSEQEDMLLSVLNASVTNITIFNKKDFHLDKDTESAFSRFQCGIHLLKQDKQLDRGLFYIAIKDVGNSDVENLIQEFSDKISKMSHGKVEIAAMAPYNKSEYYKESLTGLAETVAERVDFCYDNGFAFLRDLKLIMAQITFKDWTPICSKRLAVTVDIPRRNLQPWALLPET